MADDGEKPGLGLADGREQTVVGDRPLLYCAVSNAIQVSVSPQHLADQSDIEHEVFAFAYTVRIENHRDEEVQLLERHWLVLSNGVRVAEIVGPGVVGVQPVITPGMAHEYTSSAVIQDPVGSMEGSYTFRSPTEGLFQAKIPRFDLIYPLVLH